MTDIDYKKMIEEMGTSQKEIAHYLGVPKSRVSEWVNGKRNCTATLCLHTFSINGKKYADFKVVHDMLWSPKAIFPKTQSFYVANGLFAIIELMKIRREWIVYNNMNTSL